MATDTGTYPVPSSNLTEVLPRNTEDFDKVVNGTEDSYENRAGNQIKSLYSLNQVFNEAEVSATAAATSESNAATSASNAATSESNAATSESNASSSASAAATSENNAATSEANAAQSAQDAADSAASIGTLGTSAYADLTTSTTDTTVGRVLKVGTYGIGASIVSSGLNLSDGDYIISGCNAISASSSTLSSAPPDSATAGRYMVEFYGDTSGVAVQFATARSNGARWYRVWQGGTITLDWSLTFSTGSSATSTQINTGTSTDTVVTPSALAGAFIVSSEKRGEARDISSISPTVSATNTNDTDYEQSFYVQFSTTGTTVGNAIEISKDGASWEPFGFRSSAAGTSAAFSVDVGWRWRVTTAYLVFTEISA